MFKNFVELSGTITDIRVSDNGTNFISLAQDYESKNEKKTRYFEALINPVKANIISLLKVGLQVSIKGSLTTFRAKKYPIYKMMVVVEELLPE